MPRKSSGHFSTQLLAEELKNVHLQVGIVMAELHFLSGINIYNAQLSVWDCVCMLESALDVVYRSLATV